MTTRTGKIASLPYDLREQLNHRLLNGEKGTKILPWLNALPEVMRVLEEDFEGLRVNDQNLSDWRQGGYADWLRRRDRVEQVREMSKWSVQMAKAGGGNLTEGAAAVLSGRVLEVLEQLDGLVKTAEGDTAEDTQKKMSLIGDAIEGLTLSVARLRKGDHTAEQLKLMRERLGQTGEELKLAQQKFQRESCALFLKWFADDRAKTILLGDESNDAKTEKLGQLIFQEDWK